MVDLAKQAFGTNNFGLAAEIYERTIKEHGPKLDLYLGLADSFSRCGQFQKAFEAYTNAFRFGQVSQEKLKHLVTGLMETVKRDKQSDAKNKKCMFTCSICRGLFEDPVTVPCGHTFCRKCLVKDKSKSCHICGSVHSTFRISSVTSNLLLTRLIGKWFVDECEANRLKSEGNRHFEAGDNSKAIVYYSKAIGLVPKDHLLLSNRSYVYYLQDSFQEALEDADYVIQLRPDWPKGYFRRGAALYGLNEYEDAVVAFLQCLSLDSSVTSAKNFLSKTLHKILSPLPPDDPKSVQLLQQQNPSQLRQLITSNFDATRLFPQDAVSKMQKLKTIIDSTIAKATSFNTLVATAGPSSFNDDCECEEGTYDSDTDSTALAPSGRMPRCHSAPLSLEPSPLPPQLQVSKSVSPSSLPDLRAMSRKRCRYGSGSSGSPPSPTQTPNSKYMKSENMQEPQTNPEVGDARPIPRDLLNTDDFECSLCYQLFFLPVTTPCGHVFCRSCLDRCLDHQSNCPLCKSSLVEYLAERRQAVTEAIHLILETYLPKEYEARQKAHEEEVAELARMGSDQQSEIPIFVCTLSYPTVPCPLHIFEPRYRLMIRQCMESGTRQFGMCVALGDDENNFSEIGTMLEIRDMQFFPDGRSLVDSVGGRRFRVLERSRRDGYNTAKVEFLKDTRVDGEALTELLQVEEEIYGTARNWYDSLPEEHKQRITQHFGAFPDKDPDPQVSPNGPHWHWWVVAILPLDPRVQLTLLAMVSYKDRLLALKRVLAYLKKKSGK